MLEESEWDGPSNTAENHRRLLNTRTKKPKLKQIPIKDKEKLMIKSNPNYRSSGFRL